MAKVNAGPWYTVARIAAVLVLLAAVGGVYVWYKAFREVAQVSCGDVEPSRRAELCADPAEERFKYGSLGAARGLDVAAGHLRHLPEGLVPDVDAADRGEEHEHRGDSGHRVPGSGVDFGHLAPLRRS